MKNEAHLSINSNYKWVMLALIWLVYFAFGMILSSIPPLVTPIAQDLALTYSQIGSILGAVLLFYVPLGISVGLLIDRAGMRRLIMAAIALVPLSALLQSFATNFETLFLSVCVFGIGGPFLSVSSPKIVASWFSGRERGLASGIYVTGYFIGSSTALAITNTVILPLAGTWRDTIRLYAILGFLIAFAWLLFGRDAPHTQTGSITTVPLREAITKLLKEKYVWIVAIIGFSLSFASYGFGRWLPKLLELNGMSPTEAGFFSSVPGWFGLIGSVVIPGLGKAGSRKPLVFIILLIQGICIFTTATVIGLPLITSLVFYGISSGPTAPLLIVILMDMPQVGTKYIGAAAGIFFSFIGLGGFIGPLMVGFLADLAGTILPGIIALTVAVEAMLIFTLLMKEK